MGHDTLHLMVAMPVIGWLAVCGGVGYLVYVLTGVIGWAVLAGLALLLVPAAIVGEVS